MKLVPQAASIARATELISEAMRLLWGELLDTEGMQGTPGRVARHWAAITHGLYEDPTEPIQVSFPCKHDELVVIRDIPFFSLCEHHLLPFFGVAHVGYIPQGRVVGLSKIPRCLDIIAARPQMQERITHELGEVLQQTIQPLGTIVVLEAEHTCMSTRGVMKPGAKTITSAVRGVFETDASAKAEAFSLIKGV